MLTWKSVLIIGIALLLMILVFFMNTSALDVPKVSVGSDKSEKTLQNKKKLTELKNKINSTIQESIEEEIQKEVQKEIELSTNDNKVSE